jgi:hypothetical protein
MSIVERPTGMTEEFPEIAEFKKNALRTAWERLIQRFSKGSPEGTEAVLNQWGLESLRPFMDEKEPSWTRRV